MACSVNAITSCKLAVHRNNATPSINVDVSLLVRSDLKNTGGEQYASSRAHFGTYCQSCLAALQPTCQNLSWFCCTCFLSCACCSGGHLRPVGASHRASNVHLYRVHLTGSKCINAILFCMVLSQHVDTADSAEHNKSPAQSRLMPYATVVCIITSMQSTWILLHQFNASQLAVKTVCHTYNHAPCLAALLSQSGHCLWTPTHQ